MRYVLTLCVMLTFAGCGSRPLSHAPAESHARPGRTTVFGAPESPYRMREPWFTDRNDARPTVAAGVESPIFQHSTTRTYDHTFSHDGDVEDRYYRTRIDVRHRSTTQ